MTEMKVPEHRLVTKNCKRETKSHSEDNEQVHTTSKQFTQCLTHHQSLEIKTIYFSKTMQPLQICTIQERTATSIKNNLFEQLQLKCANLIKNHQQRNKAWCNRILTKE